MIFLIKNNLQEEHNYNVQNNEVFQLLFKQVVKKLRSGGILKFNNGYCYLKNEQFDIDQIFCEIS